MQDSPYTIKADDEENIKSTPVIQNAPLIVLVHGYTGNATFWPNNILKPGEWFIERVQSLQATFLITILSAFFGIGEYNIISLDYGEIAAEGCYIQAAQNVDTVGLCSSALLQKLFKAQIGLSPENTHVMGFSLGAHVAGAIGKYSKNLPWITGKRSLFIRVNGKLEFI